MNEHKLDCCLVRDLLPSYLEELTEPETTTMVKEHLDGCPACSALEQDMRCHLPVEPAPKRALRFLKRVKRTRLIAAILCTFILLWSIWWLYDQEFHYVNTEAGRLTAVEEYVPLPEDSSMAHGVASGTPLRVIDYTERDDMLYIGYAAENDDNVHGIMMLKRGWNGKYRALRATNDPFPYTAGVMGQQIWARNDNEENLFFLLGDSCREIYSVRVTYFLSLNGSEDLHEFEATYEITEPNFLWLMDEDTLRQTFDLPSDTAFRVVDTEVSLLNADGQDATDQYREESIMDNWSSGKGTAELFLVYVYMAIVAIFGAVCVRAFLRTD